MTRQIASAPIDESRWTRLAFVISDQLHRVGERRIAPTGLFRGETADVGATHCMAACRTSPQPDPRRLKLNFMNQPAAGIPDQRLAYGDLTGHRIEEIRASEQISLASPADITAGR